MSTVTTCVAVATIAGTACSVITAAYAPMVMPAVLYAAVLIFFLGFELFGLPLVLGYRRHPEIEFTVLRRPERPDDVVRFWSAGT